MKCSVCGTELAPNATKCTACGTIYEAKSNLKTAMSNISSLASALRAKRDAQAVSDTVSSQEDEITKVHTMDDLYTKDIELNANNDEEYSEEFDLNAFYEKSANIEDDAEDEEDESDDEEIDEDEELTEDDSDEDQYEEDEETTEDEDYGTEELEEDSEEEYSEEDSEDSEDSEEVQEDSEEIMDSEPEEEGITISFEEDDESAVKDEYIKESDIQHFDTQTEANPEQSDVNSSDMIVADAVSGFEGVNGEQIGEAPVENNGAVIGNVFNNDSDIVVPTAEDVNTSQSEEMVNGEFAAPRAEDVPFTQLEEVSSSVSNDNPIVISDKDVVSVDANSTTPQEPQGTSSASKGEKVKYNKFCGVMAIILLIIGTLAGAVVLLYHFVLSSMESNAVVDFLSEILGNPDYLMYVTLGSLGVLLLAIIFSVIQVFIKPRKMGKILLVLSVLIAGGICAGYYFADELLTIAIEYLKEMIM